MYRRIDTLDGVYVLQGNLRRDGFINESDDMADKALVRDEKFLQLLAPFARASPPKNFGRDLHSTFGQTGLIGLAYRPAEVRCRVAFHGEARLKFPCRVITASCACHQRFP